MRLQRNARIHQAGVTSEDYWEFTPGQAVMTPEGFPGKVAEVQDGPHPGSEQYVVVLDNDMGGGEYAGEELSALDKDVPQTREAAKVAHVPFADLKCPNCGTHPEAWEVDYDEDDSVHCRGCNTEYDFYGQVEQGDIYPRTRTATSDEARDWGSADREDMEGESFIEPPYAEDEALAATAVEQHTADQDYPELGTILSDRLPLAHSERVAALRARAAKRDADREAGVPVDLGMPHEAGWFGDHVLDPAAEHMLKAQEESGYGSYNIENGSMASYDWCRFRRNRRCFFPKTLDAEAAKQAGYAVWVPEDRGFCPRDRWKDQKECPAPSEPGPKSGEPNWRYETWRSWQEGGQGNTRRGSVEGVSVNYDVKQMSEKEVPKQTSPLAEDLAEIVEEHRKQKTDSNPYGGANPYSAAAKDPEFTFHVTATWRDVQAKAKRIRQGGHVRVISSTPVYLVGEVQGDTNVYQATLMREPGTHKIALWECGCAWAAYSWGRSGRWKKYEGRLCSHALALNYEGQSRGWMGGEVSEDATAPDWAKDRKVLVPGDYQKPDPNGWRVGTLHQAMPYAAMSFGEMPGGFSSRDDVAYFMLGQAAEAEPRVTALLQLHAIQHNGEMVGLEHRLKTLDSLMRKLPLKAESKGLTPADFTQPFRYVKDVLRYTIAFPEPGWGDSVQDTLYELQGVGYDLLEEENSWEPHDAYSGLHYTFKVPMSDVAFELQFHTSASVTLKEKVLHKMYEEFRDPNVALDRRQQLWNEMTKYWDDIPIPENALDFPTPKAFPMPVALRKVTTSLDVAGSPVYAMAQDMIADGDDPNEVLATLASLGVADAPSILAEAMAAPSFQVLVRGIVTEVLDLLEGGLVKVRGLGEVPSEECIYPTYNPTRGLNFSGSRKTAASTGLMVAIEPPREMAEAIHAQIVAEFGDDVEPVTNYHVTLAYPGDLDEVDPVTVEAAVRDWALRWGPMTGRFSGYGVFHQEGGDKVLYASIDLPGLERARDDLVSTLARFGVSIPDDHGYTPHMTLLYTDGDAPVPPAEMPEEAQAEFTLSEVALVVGADWKHLSLEQSRHDIGGGRDLPWGFLPWGGDDLTWAGGGEGSGLTGVGSPETAASYVASLAELHEEPEPALPATTGEDEDEDEATTWSGYAGDPDPDPRTASTTDDGEVPEPGSPRLAWLMGSNGPAPQQGDKEMNIAQAAKAHLAKTALKSFTPAEQKQIIDEGSAEGVVAANLDRLQLEGTHYVALEEALQAADTEPDDEDWLM
jgi:2'-5' RNA ligase